MKKIFFMLLASMFMLTPIFALEDDTNLEKPGISPDSMLYGLDKVFDKFQSDESVANERAAEAILMARENKIKELDIALDGYDEAMLKKEEKSKKKANEKNDTTEIENDVRHAAKHMEVLIKVREKVPENTKNSIDKIIDRATNKYDESIKNLEKKDSKKAKILSENILASLLDKLPENGQAGLEKALLAHNRNISELKKKYSNSNKIIEIH